jgi:hypothetical protein
MPGHGSKLAQKQENAIAALLTQRNHEEAARAVGISVKTLLRWNKSPEFAAALRAAKRATFSQCLGRLQQASTAAVTTVLKIMLDPTAPAASRLRAADMVLAHATKAMEMEDVEVRIAELERIAAAAKENGNGRV